jgi:hypothetical protein
MRAMLVVLLVPIVAHAGERAGPADERYAFRTDFANDHLPWYRLKPGEFPPIHSDHRVGGELIEVDFIHRAGVFRLDGMNELVGFTMPPFATARLHNTDADLQDLPLSTHLLFSLHQDENGVFNKVVVIQDDSSGLAARDQTAAQRNAAEQQRKKHSEFFKARGLPAWIDRVDGTKLTVTLFGYDHESLDALLKDEHIDPARWATEHRSVSVVVANEHLRTYWPEVVRETAIVTEYERVSENVYGCGGVRWVIEPHLALEGFRKGRIVRLFVHPSWPVKNMPFGEGLHEGGHSDEEPADAKDLEPAQFPYRTDFGNEHLPWYQLQPGRFPPEHSAHRVGGELVSVDASGRSGRFRIDRTGELVDFTLIPVGSASYLNARAELKDLPLGMRYLFDLYQDEKGAFTKAATIMDEFTDLSNNTLTYRVEAILLGKGRLIVARHAAPVKVDYVLEPRVPPDFGRIELTVDDKTHVWKGDKLAGLASLRVGDELLVNLGARTMTSRGRCTDIWIGAETHRLVTERQRAKHAAFLKERGMLGGIYGRRKP